MSKTTNLRKKYSEKIAYPTLWLTILALVIYLGAIILTLRATLPISLAILINTIMAYLLFTSMHEASHGNVSGNQKNLWLDELVGWTSSLTLFAPFYLFKIIHFKHHAHTNDPQKDPDHWLASKNFLSLLFHSFSVFPAYVYTGLKLLTGTQQLPKVIKKELWISFTFLTIMLLVLGFMIYTWGWYYPIMLWLLPAFIAQAFLAIAFDWLPHHPHKKMERYLNTRVIDVPGISLFLLSQNYHLIHHLYPTIPFYHYKNAYDEIEDEVHEKGVEVIQWKKQ